MNNASTDPRLRSYAFAGEDYVMDLDENLDHRLPPVPRESPFSQTYHFQTAD